MSSELAAAPFKKSTFRTKVRNPMVPLLIMVSLISSALIRIAAFQQEYETMNRNHESRKDVLIDIVRRLEKGEKFDVKKEIDALYSSDSDKSLEELMKEIEMAEEEWMTTTPDEADQTQAETQIKQQVVEQPKTEETKVEAVSALQTSPESKSKSSKFL